VREAEDQRHPFAPFPGTDAQCFIQWKGTEVCMDFYCACGYHGHVDEGFAYYVQCYSCGALYETGTQVKFVRVEDTGGSTAVVVARGSWEDDPVPPTTDTSG
jgi:hypothetical protein